MQLEWPCTDKRGEPRPNNLISKAVQPFDERDDDWKWTVRHRKKKKFTLGSQHDKQ